MKLGGENTVNAGRSKLLGHLWSWRVCHHFFSIWHNLRSVWIMISRVTGRYELINALKRIAKPLLEPSDNSEEIFGSIHNVFLMCDPGYSVLLDPGWSDGDICNNVLEATFIYTFLHCHALKQLDIFPVYNRRDWGAERLSDLLNILSTPVSEKKRKCWAQHPRGSFLDLC